MTASEAPRKSIVILGSTGSIGTNTLRVVEAFPGRFRVVGLAAGSDWRAIAAQARKYKPRAVALADPTAAARLSRILSGEPVKVLAGGEGVASLAEETRPSMVVSAIVGAGGLVPTWRAIAAGIDVALANKEPLVMAGRLIMREAARSGAAVIPVDSEHHAVSEAIRGADARDIDAVTLTASGGPFHHDRRLSLSKVTVAQALAHPRWKMGAKISVDSATLMNKGLEVIEAHWLFGLPGERIRVVIHPESIVHALVHMSDGGVLAYLSNPDMRLPIAAALNHPRALSFGLVPLDLEKLGRLTFTSPDHRRFPCITFAREALRIGGTSPAVMNAANEVAVAAFLEGRLPFTRIFSVIERTMAARAPKPDRSLEIVLEEDREARAAARGFIAGGTAGRGGASKKISGTNAPSVLRGKGHRRRETRAACP